MQECETNVLRVSFILCVEHICLITKLSQIWMYTSTSVTPRATNVLRDKCAPTMLSFLCFFIITWTWTPICIALIFTTGYFINKLNANK
jgi:hypothetical protein